MLSSILRRESPFIAGVLTTAILYTVGKPWLENLSNPLVFAVLFLWVFAVMLWCAFAVVRHANSLAELLGEPYGTLILTIAVIGIEASVIAAIMLSGHNDPALGRDTMLAVIIIVLNGMVGISLLMGGFRYGEQEFNPAGARAYLAVIVTLSTMTLIMPRFTISTVDASLTPLQAIVFSAITISLYLTFLGIQTMRHRGYFTQPMADGAPAEDDREEHHGHAPRSTVYHAIFLLLTLLPIVLLSKKLAILVDHITDVFGAPAALSGVLVALLVLAPRGARRLSGRLRQPPATLGQYLPRLGACHHRPDRADRVDDRADFRRARHSRPRRHRDGAARPDAFPERTHLWRRAHHRTQRGGAYRRLLRLILF